MGHEQVVFFNDETCGLKAIVAIHDTTLGPALGGCRMWPYSSEETALEDVLRLSKGMTYKASISGLNLGGGKSVIIGDPKKDKSEALFRSFGRFIESLNERYITAQDVNIGVPDIKQIALETANVVGTDKTNGGSGNPAPYTALGVLRGIEASAHWAFGQRSLEGKSVAIQGVGEVGTYLAKYLMEMGAKIFYTDINKDNALKLKENIEDAQYVHPDEIYSLDCDIFSPCALGAIINDDTIDQLKCRVVAGSANNQLKENRHGIILKEKGILYAPDYLINAGGLMNVSLEREGYSDKKSKQMVDTIYHMAMKIFAFSKEHDIPIYQATDLLAEKRIKAVKEVRTNYLGKT
ncbi:MAG: leucine dehydrogenase [Bacteriovoracales bacterium]|nr:leucine dehydrogenase [Bacteriovoracales bacterium]